MKRVLALVAILAALALSACGDEEDEPATAPSPTNEEVTGSGADDPASAASDDDDVSGNCDEAEHADDPECGGTGGVGVDDNGGDDDSGSDGSGGGIGTDDGGDDDGGTGGVGAYGSG